MKLIGPFLQIITLDGLSLRGKLSDEELRAIIQEDVFNYIGIYKINVTFDYNYFL